MSDVIQNLRRVEKNIAEMDRYFEYCTRKYKLFNYTMKLFMEDPILLNCEYTEGFEVLDGDYKGYLYWGQ